MSENEVVKMRSRLIVFKIPPLPRKGNFFSLPNEIFNIDLCAEEIALYSYLMRMEDRKTFTCYPSFRTIGKALRMSRNTVMKYVRSLEDKCLIVTERTTVITSKRIKRNGNLKYQILPIQCAVDEFHRKQPENYFAISEHEKALKNYRKESTMLPQRSGSKD